jgi:hypothetical protein
VILSFSLQSLNEFQTTHLLNIDAAWIMGFLVNNGQFVFPWDQYTLRTTFIAVNHENNATLPILKLAPAESVDDFLPSFKDYPATSYFNGTADVSGRAVISEIRRTPLVKAFSMTICLVNWLLAGMILFITVVAFRGNKDLADMLLLLPITVILIVPSLRALMVDSPIFGELLTNYIL